MPGVLGGEPLSFKDMPKVGTAVGTDDLDSHSVAIGHPLDRALNLVIEAGPATAGVEFVLRPVKVSAAPLTYVDSRLEMVGVFSGEGPLGSLTSYDPLLF